MSKTCRQLFAKYSLVIPPKLIWHQDGIPGQRIFFISDKKETVVVSFEEGMKLMGMTPDTDKSVPTVSYQCCKDGKYIHQKRNTADNMAYSYFHIEWEDEDGELYTIEEAVELSTEDLQFLRELKLADLPEEIPNEDDGLILLDAPVIKLTVTFIDNQEVAKSLTEDASIQIYQRFLPYFINN